MKYKNQEYLKMICDDVNSKTPADRENIIKHLKMYQEEAVYEYNKINDYTAPEEVEARTQAVYYYEDLLSMLGE